MDSKQAQAPHVDAANLRKFKIFVEDMNPGQAKPPGQGAQESAEQPPVHNVYDADKQRQQREQQMKKRRQRAVQRTTVTDANKSYESMGSEEEDDPHFDFDSDAEPPTDQVGDRLTVIKKGQCVKTILEVGENNTGKPGRPFIVSVNLIGYFAPSEEKTAESKETVGSEQSPAVTSPEGSDQINSSEPPRDGLVTKKETDTHVRVLADDIKGRGEVFVDHYDLDLAADDTVDRQRQLKLTLGDDRLPHGLWKAIEHMRRGERARIMIKPAWAYNHPKFRNNVVLPRGWETAERVQALRSRRVFFEVKLHDWIARYDINADGLLIKTLKTKGDGFDRPGARDEVLINMKLHQSHAVFADVTDLRAQVDDKSQIPDTVRTILATMKTGEVVSCLVQPAHFLHYDKDLKGRPKEEGGYPDIDEDQILHVELALKDIRSITDVFRDGTTISKVLEKVRRGSEQFSTASPFSDSQVALRLKLEAGDQVLFDNFQDESPDAVIWCDMEYYQIPATLRRVLKVSKLHELVEVTTSKAIKLVDTLPDSQNNIFDRPEIRQCLAQNQSVKMTFKMLEIRHRSNPAKLVIAERVERISGLLGVARAFFERAAATQQKKEEEVTPLEKQMQIHDFKKTEKLCLRIERYHRAKEQASQFEEEDENSLEFRNCADQLYALHQENFLMHSKALQIQNKLKAALAKINLGLQKVDHRHFESLRQKVAILEAMNDYAQAQQVLADMLDFNSQNQGDIVETTGAEDLEGDQELQLTTEETIKAREATILQLQERMAERIAKEKEDEIQLSKTMLGIQEQKE